MALRLPPGVSPAEPVAVAVGALVGILSILHVPDRLGLSADDVGQLAGYAIALAAVVRGWVAAMRATQP